MLSGDRRWASARRGGMTVLGKVAVPKPLNLPSQRLENHGLDPNVEIVPKGTLGWGSRPSSSGSNPWISSSLSPSAEGGTVSPSHLSSRPSSGGSGTRPSTAGSERSHEPVSSGVWGSNSRPSSASGTLSSNQTSSSSLRPRSADNRPNSSHSQLSRFADQDNKNSAAWDPNVAAERLGVKSSKEECFSLTSGDFPTLGTAKDNSMAITELEGDHGRPSSASGRIAHGKEETRSDAKHGTMNAWRADGPENDIHPSMDKWHGDNPPHYFNPNASPQHFDVWRGPPMNDPSGAWYRGRPRGPPFVGPRGFPMEPFPYYHHQPGLLPGPRGSHPKNGDLYRPGMPFRPGFYPGQPAFESFYGPPMGYERDVPYMGMSAGPPVYSNSYPGSAPDIGNSHGRDGHGHHGSKTSSDEVDSKDTQGPKRITLKSRNQCDQWGEGESGERNLQQPDVSYPEKKCFPMTSSVKNEWGAEEEDPEEAAVYVKKRPPNEKFSRGYDYRAHSSDGMKVKSIEGTGNVKAVNDTWTNVSESERDPSLPALMQKIDGLNAKIRVTDGWNDSPGAYNREEVRKMSQTVDSKIKNGTGEVSKAAGSSRDIVSFGDKPIQPMIALSRRPHHGGQGRVDHRGKGKFSNQDADGWRKKPLTTESSNVIKASHNESRAHVIDNVEVASENSVINPVLQIVGGLVETHDSIDIQAQQAKARETTKQRTLQLQKEEEERIKEQRVKLDKLNQRTVTVEAGPKKAEKIQIINGQANEPSIADHNNANHAGEAVEIPKNLPVESDVSTSLPVQEDAHDDSAKKAAPQYNDSRHKRGGYKQKQKSFTEKSVANNDITSGEHYPSSETKPSEIVQRRKSNRSSKNRQRPDETLLAPVELSVNPVSPVIEPEPNRAVKAQQVLPNKESHISQWNSHRQVNNKPHGSGDTAVWAPVNKAKVSVEANPDAAVESTNSRKGCNNSVNEKRAEMERYVPKPVAKELLAQQVNGDIISHNKHRKYHGMRKQPQSYRMKGESQSEKRDFVKVNAEGPDDGCSNHIGSNNANTLVKDQGATGRGNRNNNNETDLEISIRNVAGSKGRGRSDSLNQGPGRNNRQNNLPVNAPPFRDNRQSQNTHYENQSVGPFKGSRPGRDEELNEGAGSTGLGHRERGIRRFSRRQSGPAPANADPGWGD